MPVLGAGCSTWNIARMTERLGTIVPRGTITKSGNRLLSYPTLAAHARYLEIISGRELEIFPLYVPVGNNCRSFKARVNQLDYLENSIVFAGYSTTPAPLI